MNIYTHTLLTITHLKHLKHDKKGKGKEKAIDGDEPMDIDESWGDRKECIRGLIKGVILRVAKKEIFCKGLLNMLESGKFILFLFLC